MKSDFLTLRKLYYNPDVFAFFLRSQSEETFKELLRNVKETANIACDLIEDYCDDLDTLEEMLYNDSIEELAEAFGLTLLETYEDEDED